MNDEILKTRLERAEKKVSILEEMIESKTRELYFEKESLEAAKERAETITRVTPSAVFTVDKGRKITSWNKRAEEIVGYKAEEVIGKDCLIFAEHPCKEKCGLYAEDTAKPMTGKECVIKTKDGRTRHISKNADIFKNKDGAVIGGIESFEDITERKLAEEKLKQVNEKIEEKLKEEIKNREVMLSILEDVAETRDKLEITAKKLAASNQDLEQFAYVASHDLQEPLRMVASYVQLIEQRYKEKLDDEALEFMNYITEGAHRMQILISDLLKYSRVGTKGKEFKEVDCNNVLYGALNNLKAAIDDGKALVTNDKLPVVTGDDVQLMQLFQNLIANALKFQGEARPNIHISAAEKENEWVFGVKDNGIGIDPKFHGRIFIIFQRLHKRTEYEGTGIGLAICKKIVERHGGRIWVESEAGHGAAFYFTIPKNTENKMAENDVATDP